jgi:dTDP-4-amino-4,6-dideoxygalactose transaminase
LVHCFGFKIQNIKEIALLCKNHNLIVVEDCAHLYNYNLSNFSDAGSFGDYVFYSLHKNFPMKNGGLVVQNNTGLKTFSTTEVTTEANLPLELMQYDARAIAIKRLENFKILDAEINKIQGIYPLKSLTKNDIPHTYPVIVEDNLREKLYFWLADNNMTVIALYYRLIDAVNDGKYSMMQNISDSILNLPIHQGIDNYDIKRIVKGVKQFYGES